MYHYKECGLNNIKLVNGYEIHKTPYGKSVSITNVHELHRLIGEELIKKPDALAPEEIRFLRKEMQLSQKLLADTLGVVEVTFRGWESGKAKISGPADRLLRVLYKEYCDKTSVARELVDQLSRLDRQVHKAVKQFKFAVTANSWVRKAAGAS